jgi:hypothetical protein
MPTASIDDIWLFIYKQSEVRTRDITREFVTTKRLSRGTMYKYKRQLELEGKIQAKAVTSRPPHNVYFVPTRFHRELEALRQYKQFASDPPIFWEPRPPDSFHPTQSTLVNLNAMEWEDAPGDLFLTKVQQKILWHDSKSGALLVLYKTPPGIAEALHYHPYANMWGLLMAGEIELPDGSRMPTENLFGYVPRGVKHIHPKITKESIGLVYFDGPRTKIEVS